jgi:hypothetical protein
MTFSKMTTFSGAMAAAVLSAVCIATPARAQVAPTVLQTKTSSDGLLTLVLSSTNPSDAVDVDNTYTWTAINNSTTVTLTGVILGSHWGDWCPGGDPIGNSCAALRQARRSSHSLRGVAASPSASSRRSSLILACGARPAQA